MDRGSLARPGTRLWPEAWQLARSSSSGALGVPGTRVGLQRGRDLQEVRQGQRLQPLIPSVHAHTRLLSKRAHAPTHTSIPCTTAARAQSLLRMHAGRLAFLELRGATVLAQRTWRAAHVRAIARAAAAHERARTAAATHVQAALRSKREHARCVCVCMCACLRTCATWPGDAWGFAGAYLGMDGTSQVY